jgi:hypothetical protein
MTIRFVLGLGLIGAVLAIPALAPYPPKCLDLDAEEIDTFGQCVCIPHDWATMDRDKIPCARGLIQLGDEIHKARKVKETPRLICGERDKPGEMECE